MPGSCNRGEPPAVVEAAPPKRVISRKLRNNPQDNDGTFHNVGIRQS
ncbi:MAG: hypothetical protein MI923_02040 [Phycisphaerales bacterium]|nr:hypothetical protein [Phycisphaerales bacterium]